MVASLGIFFCICCPTIEQETCPESKTALKAATLNDFEFETSGDEKCVMMDKCSGGTDQALMKKTWMHTFLESFFSQCYLS